MIGRLADVEWGNRLGKAVVDAYSKAYDVEFDECKKSGGFTSFDDFFTRELRDVKDVARHKQTGSVDRTAARAARDLAALEALCELVREFKIGRRTLAELALGQSLI